MNFLISLVVKQISWIEFYEIFKKKICYIPVKDSTSFYSLYPLCVLCWQRGAMPAFTDGVVSLPGCPPDEHGV